MYDMLSHETPDAPRSTDLSHVVASDFPFQPRLVIRTPFKLYRYKINFNNLKSPYVSLLTQCVAVASVRL